MHFHAVIRLDGPDGAGTAPPGWATTVLLADAVHGATGLARLIAPGSEIVGRHVLSFGIQTDVRPIAAFGAGERLTSAAVARYIAKYATKGAEAAGAVDGRIHRARDLVMLPVRDHTLRMIGTCWWLGGLPAFEPLGLRRWAHMLGYGGHFSTKSRRYSTTLTALRQARAEHRALEQRGALGLGDRATVTVGQWRYVGRGYSPEAALIATSAREGRSTMADRLLSVQQAAERLGTSVRFPRRLIAERRITFVRVGRHVRIPEAALDDFISRNTTRPISRRIGRAVA